MSQGVAQSCASSSAAPAVEISWQHLDPQADQPGGADRRDLRRLLLSAADRSGKWRPGGWMPFAIHPASERLFVLMHRGGTWTHKAAGEEVWVFDLREKKRVERVRLEEPASSVALSLDDAPLLYTIADETQDLDIWDARTMHHKATLEE